MRIQASYRKKFACKKSQLRKKYTHTVNETIEQKIECEEDEHATHV